MAQGKDDKQECNICKATFPSRSQLFRHLRLEHDHPTIDDETFLSARARTAASIASRSTYQNVNYEAYYRLQGIVEESEWQIALEYFRQPLPVAFRIHQNYHYQQLLLLAKLPGLQRLLAAHDCVGASPYFDSQMCRVAKKPVREWPEDLQQVLRDAQTLGVLHRQELCSMLPPFLLLLQSSSSSSLSRAKVLDLCAAPGSKTLQLLDLLEQQQQQQHNNVSFQGMLVANDTNRARLLTVARRARLTGQSQHLLLNVSDGRYFPTLRKWGGYKVKFDYVLADVPCSGDGTLRKLSSTAWQQWNVHAHLTLHKLQVRLLTRALELVQKGGRVVYSTCSLDPLENEAVVTAAITRMGGPTLYRIVPVPTRFCTTTTNNNTNNNYTNDESSVRPFPHAPGVASWVVPHPQFSADHPVVYQRYDAVPDALRQKKALTASMFAPRSKLFQNKSDTTISVNSENQKAETANQQQQQQQQQQQYNLLSESDVVALEEMLPHCCRILPQHLDSGGFFCAIIERLSPVYFAVSLPRQRSINDKTSSSSSSTNIHHGRIYWADHNEKANAAPSSIARQIRAHVMASESQKEFIIKEEDINVEGLPTLEKAQQWLRQHSAFVERRSETPSMLPSVSSSVLPKCRQNEKSDNHNNTSASTAKTEKTPIYNPLFSTPHPDLVAEFVDFFGLCTTAEQAAQARVERFPVEQLIVVGGGQAATQVTSCVDLLNPENTSVVPTDQHVVRDKTKFMQLTLVSEEIRSLFAGGAKFNPLEVGLSLCWVPVSTSNKRRSLDQDKTASRAETSGRYGLLDEAAPWMAQWATRRKVMLSREHCVRLLETGKLALHDLPRQDIDDTESLSARDKSTRLDHCENGAIIAICETVPSLLCFSCVKKDEVLALLTERGLAEAWLRML